MAKSHAIPDPLARRHELEKPLEPARARAIGEAYLAEGRELEALAFLKKAGASDALERVCATAVARGDSFLLREGCTALGREPLAREWEQLERAASTQGRDRYAAEAKRQVERLAGRNR
jgi:hypothetical protein